jgi:hypothetical protein
MREDSQSGDLRDVLVMFDALAEHLDELTNLHAADGDGAEVAARIANAKLLACRASERIRAHLGGQSN